MLNDYIKEKEKALILSEYAVAFRDYVKVNGLEDGKRRTLEEVRDDLKRAEEVSAQWNAANLIQEELAAGVVCFSGMGTTRDLEKRDAAACWIRHFVRMSVKAEMTIDEVETYLINTITKIKE